MPPDEIKMKPETAIGVLENLHYQIKDQLQYAHHNAFKTAIEALEKQLEVVRCGDCKFNDECENLIVFSSCYCEIEKSEFVDYCSCGERAEVRNED